MPQLDEAMADTTLDILTDGPSAEAAPSAAEVRQQLPSIGEVAYSSPFLPATHAAAAGC